MKYIHILNKELPREYLDTITTSEWLELGYGNNSSDICSTGWLLTEEDIKLIPKKKLRLSQFGWNVPKEIFYKFRMIKDLKKEVEV